MKTIIQRLGLFSFVLGLSNVILFGASTKGTAPTATFTVGSGSNTKYYVGDTIQLFPSGGDVDCTNEPDGNWHEVNDELTFSFTPTTGTVTEKESGGIKSYYYNAPYLGQTINIALTANDKGLYFNDPESATAIKVLQIREPRTAQQTDTGMYDSYRHRYRIKVIDSQGSPMKAGVEAGEGVKREEKTTLDNGWKEDSPSPIEHSYVTLGNLDANAEFDDVYGITCSPASIAALAAGYGASINVRMWFRTKPHTYKARIFFPSDSGIGPPYVETYSLQGAFPKEAQIFWEKQPDGTWALNEAESFVRTL
jgi:hypothetical protein